MVGRAKLLAILFFILAPSAYSQGIPYQLNPPAPNARVQFCPVPDGGYPCPTLTTVYSDSATTQVINQPISTGSSGNLSVYFAAGTPSVTVQLLGQGYGPQNRFIASLGGGVGAAINVKSLGAVGDTKYATGVTLSRIFPTVTLPATSTATVGQLIQCGSVTAGVEVVPFPANNGGQTLPATITAVNGQVVTYNTLPVGSGTDLTDGQCFFGHNDTVPITTAYNNCKTASKAIQFSTFTQNYPCNVYLPAGGYMITSTPANETGSGGNTMGVGIIGDGINASILYPMLGYTNSAPANCGFVICGFGWGQTYKDFAIDLFASSLNTAGIAFANMNVTALNCGLCYVENVRISNWYDGGVSTLYMMEDTGGAEIHHVRLENPFGGASGGGAFQCNGCGSDMYDSFLSNTNANLNVSNVGGRGAGTYFNVHGGITDEGSIITIAASKSVSFMGAVLMGGANCISVDATSEVRLTGGYCGTFNGNPGGGGPTVASGGKLWMADVEVNANGAGQYCYNQAAAGGIIDLGGNLCILAGGATAYNAGSFVNTSALTHTYPQPFLPALPTSGTAQTIVAFTPSSAVSVKNFTITSSNSATCATPPTFQITNGTQTITQTFASSGNISGPFTPTQTVTNDAFPAGTQITLSITTAAYACATAPVNMNWSIEWQSTAPSF